MDNEKFYYRIGDIKWDGVTVLRALTVEEIDAIEARALNRVADFLEAASLDEIAKADLTEHDSPVRRQRIIMQGIAGYLRRRATKPNPAGSSRGWGIWFMPWWGYAVRETPRNSTRPKAQRPTKTHPMMIAACASRDPARRRAAAGPWPRTRG